MLRLRCPWLPGGDGDGTGDGSSGRGVDRRRSAINAHAEAGNDEVILAPICRVMTGELLSPIFTWEHRLKLTELGSDTGILGASAMAMNGLRKKGKEGIH